MGLAASQARFLGITARKSNIEYEGQQVNQQRTALAEEVNSLYNKLLSLDVPIAPDATDYYETNYSFNISSSQSGYKGEYLIKEYYENADGTYYIKVDRTVDKVIAEENNLPENKWEIIQDADGKYYLKQIGSEENKFELSEITDTAKNEEIRNLINETAGIDHVADDTSFYSYKTSDGLTYYIDKGQVETKEPKHSYLKTNKTTTTSDSFDNVKITFDANNRMSSITIPDVVTGLDVDTTRVHNDEAYEAALRDYTMSKDEYNKMVADLNAQTESLQQEDKVLELRLNQIDTEQNELQTELEAVKKVLEENIENTFKTFA